MAKAKRGPATMPDDQVDQWNAVPFYRPGVAYTWVLTHGWVCVGYFVGMPDPLTIRVAHSNYYRSAGNQTHASLARNGGNVNTSWEYMGDELISRPHVIRATPYHGAVPESPIRS